MNALMSGFLVGGTLGLLFAKDLVSFALFLAPTIYFNYRFYIETINKSEVK